MKSLFIFSFILSVSSLFTSPALALDQTSQKIENSFLIENEKNTIQIFKEASPLVVSVDSTRLATDFFSSNHQEIPAGSGTGFIWDDKGHVITNFHVIQRALNSSSQIWVTIKNGKRQKAQLIGSEPLKDIAVLKIKNFDKTSTGFSQRISQSNKLQVGQKVLAIGNPFGFEQTLTTGIISALNRSMPSAFSSVTIRNMVQTDASINPGNSGGPLLDSRGYLTGMNTAIISGSGSSAGIGFAVPANTIRRIANQIINFGEVQQAGLGITHVDGYRKQILARYGYDVKEGVVIETVQPGSPADKAGLRGITEDPRRGVKLGDIITSIDNKTVSNFDDLYNLLSEKNDGDQISLKIKRNGRPLTKKIRLALLHRNIRG